MPSMPPYPVYCYGPGCRERAAYKVAAEWSDGLTRELKTYYLSCPGCLAGLFARAKAKQAGCRLTIGESLAVPGVYELKSGSRDVRLVRRADLETDG